MEARPHFCLLSDATFPRGGGFRMQPEGGGKPCLVEFTLARFVAHTPTSAVLLAYGGHSLYASQALVLSADSLTGYDSTNGVTLLANANLPATNRFTLPL